MDLPRPDTSSAQPPHDGLDEGAWLDVIQKMDEVYSKLVADEIELESKNAKLEQSQQFIMSLLTAMSDVLIACNQDGLIEETNAAFCRLVGRSDESLRGTSVLQLLGDETSVARWRECTSRTGSTEGATVEINLRDANNQMVPVDTNCTPRYSSSGQVMGHVMVGRPLGELKRAYHQLREVHEALKRAQQQLMHSAKMASLGRLVGRSDESLRGTSVLQLLGDETSVARWRECTSRTGSTEGATVEINLRDAHNQMVPVDMNCTPRYSSSGQVMGHVMVGS